MGRVLGGVPPPIYTLLKGTRFSFIKNIKVSVLRPSYDVLRRIQHGGMSFVWAQNDHVKANFFHHVKLWASALSTSGLGGFGELLGATGGFWEL